jgi:hypothetical protein
MQNKPNLCCTAENAEIAEKKEFDSWKILSAVFADSAVNAKQSQFAGHVICVKSYSEIDYDDSAALGGSGNKANQSRFRLGLRQ